MHQPDLLEIFVLPLEREKIDYLITGSVASTFYGEPRLTHDIDLVLMLRETDLETFVSLFPAAEFYCPPKEVIRIECARKAYAHFNLIHHDTGYKADIYPFAGDPLHAWAFKKRRRIEVMPNLSVWIAPPEYVIVRKLQYFKEGGSQKHLSDIRKMLDSPDREIDDTDLRRLIHDRGLQEEWIRAKSFE